MRVDRMADRLEPSREKEEEGGGRGRGREESDLEQRFSYCPASTPCSKHPCHWLPTETFDSGTYSYAKARNEALLRMCPVECILFSLHAPWPLRFLSLPLPFQYATHMKPYPSSVKPSGIASPYTGPLHLHSNRSHSKTLELQSLSYLVRDHKKQTHRSFQIIAFCYLVSHIQGDTI